MTEADFSAARWRSSSYSGDSGNCVQVAFAAPEIGVRDSKRPSAGTLVFTGSSWSRFLLAVEGR